MKDQWRKKIWHMFWCVGMVLALCACLKCSAVKAEAATAYTKLWGGDENQAVKRGKYYLKFDSESGKTLLATRKNGPYKKTPIRFFGAFANDKQAYYVRDNILCSYVFSKRTEKKLKKLSNSSSQFFGGVSAVYGSQIFVTKSSFDQWKHWTYSYNTKSKKLKKVMDNCAINDQSGKYVVAQNEYRSDVSPYKATVYKITSSGLKKVKTLGDSCFCESYVNGKLYYSVYPKNETGYDMSRVTLYRSNPDGSGRKKIKTFTSSGEVMVIMATTKYCHVYKDGHTYKYTYNTKKMKKIS